VTMRRRRNSRTLSEMGPGRQYEVGYGGEYVMGGLEDGILRMKYSLTLQTALVAGLVTLFSTVAEARAQTVRSELRDFMRAAHFNGSVAVVHGGEVLLAEGYGHANLELDVPNTTNTKFRLGSITKQFTAMAIMLLQDRGRLSVEDSVGAHYSNVPEVWRGLRFTSSSHTRQVSCTPGPCQVFGRR